MNINGFRGCGARKMAILMNTENTLKFLGNQGIQVVEVCKRVYGCSPKGLKRLNTKYLTGKLGELKNIAYRGGAM